MGKKSYNILNPKQINIFYGIPNAYTSYSTGKVSPYEAFNYCYHNKLNFLITTDQNSFFKDELKNSSKWLSLQKISHKFYKKHESFIPLIGFEAKTLPYGDMYIVNSNSYFLGEVKNINLLILWMLRNHDAFLIMKNPIKTTVSLPYNSILNSIITSIEVCNGEFGKRYIRREKYYFMLLDKGWKLGAVNSQNNKSLNFGDFDNLTGVICTKFNKENLINAFRKRHTFSSESRSLKLYFFANNTFMGGIINKPISSLKFSIILEDPYFKIEKIEIITNKGITLHSIDNIKLHKVKYIYEHTIENTQSWFLIKIYQENNRVAISSPIFIE